MEWGGFARAASVFGHPTGLTRIGGWVIPPDRIQRDHEDPTVMAMRVKITSRLIGTAEAPGGANLSATSPCGFFFGIIDWGGVPAFEDADLYSTVAPTPAPTSTEMPDPVINANMDWLYRYAGVVASTTTSGTLTFNGSNDLEYLSKAKRRMGNHKGLLWVATAFDNNQANAYAFSFDVRYLLKG